MSSRASSLREGAFYGACVALVAAIEIVSLNRRTINPASAAFLGVLWIVAGGAAGAGLGMLAARGADIVRTRREDAVVFLSIAAAGHLLLPLGLGPVVALATLGARLARRALAPARSRLDRGMFLLILALVADRAVPESLALAPDLGPDTALAADIPRPDAVPVTLTVRPAGAFPEIPAVHVRARRLRTELPGLRAALFTGRLPSRTNAGPNWPRAVLGGGGLCRIPNRWGTRAITAPFPRVQTLEGTPFQTRGTLEDVARSAGVPVLRTLPQPNDPPLYLRVIETNDVLPLETAAQFVERGAWLDVSLDENGDAELALAGRGLSVEPAGEEVTVLDVTPTALHLLGLAVPRDCDGRVLLERLAESGVAARPPRYRALASSGPGSSRTPPASAATTSK